MYEDERAIDDAMARAPLDERLPEWAEEPLRRVPDSGPCNAIYQLSEEMGIRLPQIHWVKAQIEKECRWSPELAGRGFSLGDRWVGIQDGRITHRTPPGQVASDSDRSTAVLYHLSPS